MSSKKKGGRKAGKKAAKRAIELEGLVGDPDREQGEDFGIRLPQREVPEDFELPRREPEGLRESLSSRALEILEVTHRFAELLGHRAATTGHLIAAITKEESGITGDLFTDINAFPEMFWRQVATVEEVEPNPEGWWFDQEVAKSLERARDAADCFEDEEVEPEHLFLGLLSLPTGMAARILEEFSIDRVEMREETLAMMGIDYLDCPDWERGIKRRRPKKGRSGKGGG